MDVKKLSKADMVCAENMIKVIAQGKFEFSGLEAMSFVKTCQWFNIMFSEMQKVWQVQEASAKAAMGKSKSPVKVEQPKKGKKKGKKKKKAK